MMRLRFLLSAMVLIAVFKGMSEMTAPQCWDCFAHYGFPFAYYNMGGFAGGAGIIWPGLLGDLVIVILGAIVMVAVWEFVSRRVSGSGLRG